MKLKQNIKQNYHVYGLVVWFAAMALFLALTAGQVGCSMVMQGASGAIHGLGDDLDSMTDSMTANKKKRDR